MPASSSEALRQLDLGDEYSTNGAKALQAGQVAKGHEWFTKAIKAYELGLDAAPDDDIALVCNLKLCIGARKYSIGDIDGAVVLYDSALAALRESGESNELGELGDLYSQAQLNHAECLLAQGEEAAARVEIQEVLSRSPDHPYATMLLERLRVAGGS